MKFLWAKKQWKDISGDAKWDLVKWAGGSVIALTYVLFQKLRGLPVDLILTCIIFGAAVAAFVWLGKRPLQNPIVSASQNLAQPTSSEMDKPSFSFDKFFLQAHASQFTDELTNRVARLAADQHPDDQVQTLAKFIGIGYWSYLHDMTWAYIFRSQINALTALNAEGGLMPITKARAFYLDAKSEFPKTYAEYPFENWLGFMLGQQLLLRHPTEMLEITYRGRDFLKFLTHFGFSAGMRAN